MWNVLGIVIIVIVALAIFGTIAESIGGGGIIIVALLVLAAIGLLSKDKKAG